jgi:MSHA biogenesis protein MshO
MIVRPMNARRPRGFTLLEMVVAIAIAAVVIVFASMFIAAPIDAFEAQSDRNVLVQDAAAAWPRMQQDLRTALPNSIRRRRNGSYEVVEMLTVAGVSRYTATLASPFAVAGTGGANGRVFTNAAALNNDGNFYVSVNNRGVPTRDAYARTGSMTAVRPQLTFATDANGVGSVTVVPATAMNVLTAAPSPRRRVYLVTEAVTYLCDERAGQGTLRRYSGYTIAAAQTARDAPNEFGTATSNQLIARGLTSCSFAATAVDQDVPQTVSVRLTATRNGGETVTLLHSASAEYAP